MLVSNPDYADIFVPIDVHNLVGRCEHAECGTLVNTQKYPSNQIDIAFSKVKAMAELASKHAKRVCLAFSAQENSNVRRSVYPNYKIGRIKNPPLDLDVKWWDGSQRTVRYDGVRDFMTAVQWIPCCVMGMPNDDGETDDAIASFCYKVAPKPCFVLTEDRDYWSLMSDRVSIYSKPEKKYGIEELKVKFGITTPTKLGLAKALFGDDSDKISPTVPGIGMKSVGAELESCRSRKGERQWAHAFFRELEGRSDERKIANLLARRQDIEYAERWIRLRRVELSFRYGERNPEKFKKYLEWFGVNRKLKGFMEFAVS